MASVPDIPQRGILRRAAANVDVVVARFDEVDKQVRGYLFGRSVML